MLEPCVYLTWNASYLKRLSTLKKKAVNIIAGIHWKENATPYTPYFATLNILKLEDIYKHEIAKLMHKCVHKNTPEIVFYFCQHDAHTIDSASIKQI